MKAVDYLRSTGTSIYNFAGSCAKLIPRPSSISTTAKVSLFALALFSLSQVASSKEPVFFATQCKATTTIYGDSGESINLDFSQKWGCSDNGPNLAACFQEVDFSGFSCSSLATLMSKSIEFFGIYAKCLHEEGRIKDSYTSFIDLQEKLILFFYELNLTQS